jgi:hypothetical protein
MIVLSLINFLLDLKRKLLINYTAAIETIERMDEDIELKGNKINILTQQLKNFNHYDEQKINSLLNKNPVIRNNKRERVV